MLYLQPFAACYIFEARHLILADNFDFLHHTVFPKSTLPLKDAFCFESDAYGTSLAHISLYLSTTAIFYCVQYDSSCYSSKCSEYTLLFKSVFVVNSSRISSIFSSGINMSFDIITKAISCPLLTNKIITLSIMQHSASY